MLLGGDGVVRVDVLGGELRGRADLVLDTGQTEAGLHTGLQDLHSVLGWRGRWQQRGRWGLPSLSCVMTDSLPARDFFTGFGKTGLKYFPNGFISRVRRVTD